MAQTRRVFKVAGKIRELLAMELLGRAEPRFALITITSVVVSPDLRVAKVYWSAPQSSLAAGTPATKKGVSKKPAGSKAKNGKGRTITGHMHGGNFADGTPEREDIGRALAEHSTSLRMVLAQRLGLRAVPYLKFFFDETMDKVEEVERLFQRVRAEDAGRVEHTVSDNDDAAPNESENEKDV